MQEDLEARQRNVAILIFDGIEVLDFAGPFEVFNVSGELISPSPFNVYTVWEEAYPIQTRGKLSVTPHYSIEDTPPPDILLIPGGAGTRPLLQNSTLLNWIKEQAEGVELLLSVCTGALVLAKAGLLDGLTVTTHQDNLDELRQLAPKAKVVGGKRYHDNGKIITAAGVSAGIDMSLYVVHKLLGPEKLAVTLQEMEYTWSPEA
jgi:transcriptional regulator GlxA family with amidase domain